MSSTRSCPDEVSKLYRSRTKLRGPERRNSTSEPSGVTVMLVGRPSRNPSVAEYCSRNAGSAMDSGGAGLCSVPVAPGALSTGAADPPQPTDPHTSPSPTIHRRMGGLLPQRADGVQRMG